MHSAQTALRALELLWNNYHILGEQVDTEMMSPERLDQHIERNSLLDPLRQSAWLGRIGLFIATWTLWEAYSRFLCERLPRRVRRQDRESFVELVRRWLEENGIEFAGHEWFSGANSLRNLIVHYGARVVDESERLLQRAQHAFPDLRPNPDGYVLVEKDHLSELKDRIEEFIRETGASGQ